LGRALRGLGEGKETTSLRLLLELRGNAQRRSAVRLEAALLGLAGEGGTRRRSAESLRSATSLELGRNSGGESGERTTGLLRRLAELLGLTELLRLAAEEGTRGLTELQGLA